MDNDTKANLLELYFKNLFYMKAHPNAKGFEQMELLKQNLEIILETVEPDLYQIP